MGIQMNSIYGQSLIANNEIKEMKLFKSKEENKMKKSKQSGLFGVNLRNPKDQSKIFHILNEAMIAANQFFYDVRTSEGERYNIYNYVDYKDPYCDDIITLAEFFYENEMLITSSTLKKVFSYQSIWKENEDRYNRGN